MFSNTTIPVPIKDNAFMHGFIIVIMTLLAVSVVAAFLSAAARRGRESGIVNHELTGSAVISTGFFSGFNQETRGLSLFIMLLLAGGMASGIATLRWHQDNLSLPPSRQQELLHNEQAMAQAQRLAAAEQEARAYYVQKIPRYRCPDRSKAPQRPPGGRCDKNGVFIRRLSIRGKTVTDHRTDRPGMDFGPTEQRLVVAPEHRGLRGAASASLFPPGKTKQGRDSTRCPGLEIAAIDRLGRPLGLDLRTEHRVARHQDQLHRGLHGLVHHLGTQRIMVESRPEPPLRKNSLSPLSSAQLEASLSSHHRKPPAEALSDGMAMVMCPIIMQYELPEFDAKRQQSRNDDAHYQSHNEIFHGSASTCVCVGSPFP